METGTERIELASFEAMDAARGLIEKRWTGPTGLQRLWSYGGGFLEWYEGGGWGRWVFRDRAWLKGELWRLLDASVRTREAKGGTEVIGFGPTRSSVADVLEALESLVQWPGGNLPRWVGREGPDPKYLVAMMDCVVDVGATARGLRETGRLEWVTYEKDESFLTTTCLHAPFLVGSTCGRYERYCEEWSGGDKGKVELRERFYGYALLGTRKYSRVLVEYGKVRAGKGLFHRLVGRLMGGSPAFCGTLVDELANGFGLDNPSRARLLVVDEVGGMSGMVGKRLATLLKACVGQSEMQVNRKHQALTTQTLECAVVVVSHELLAMPNEQRGVTSKLLPLHFEESFLGKEEWDLEEKLWAERDGVAMRLLEAAVRLEAEVEPGKKFVVGEGGEELRRKFEAESNVWDSFLMDYFEADARWQVSLEVVRGLRREWEREVNMVLENGKGNRVSDMRLGSALVNGSSWGLRMRRGAKGAWVVSGLKLRPSVQVKMSLE